MSGTPRYGDVVSDSIPDTLPQAPTAVRAVRGAIQLEADEREHVLASTRELVTAVLAANDLTKDDVISIVFTATPDVHSEFPAVAARELGMGDVPLMCTQELDIAGAMPLVIRLMAHVNTPAPALRGHARLPARGGRAAPGPGAVTLPAGAHVRIVGTGLIGTSLGLALSRTACARRPWTTRPPDGLRPGPRPRGRRLPPGDPAPAVVVVAARRTPWPRSSCATRAPGPSGGHGRRLGQARRPGRGARRSGVTCAATSARTPWPDASGPGAIAAQADLFEGRSLGACRTRADAASAIAAVRTWPLAVGAAPSRMMPGAEHDAAVAAVSHVPQVAASLVAARLRDAARQRRGAGRSGTARRHPDRGQRPDAVDPDPGRQRPRAAGGARAARRDLDDVAAGRRGAATRLADGGGRARARGPGAGRWPAATPATPGSPASTAPRPRHTPTVTVLVPDEPGELGRLLHDVGEAGINLEDLHLEHGMGQPVGLAELAVLPAAAEPLTTALRPARLARARLSSAPPRSRGCRGPLRGRPAGTGVSPGDRTVSRSRRRHRRPLGSGKSSVSRAVARSLGLGYLDTGAMYRALTWWCLARGRRPRRPRGGRRSAARGCR